VFDDYPLDGRSNRELRRIAARTRSSFNLREDEQVDIIACLRTGSVLTLTGRKNLALENVPDRDMGRDEGNTIHLDSGIVIRVRQTVYNQVVFGVGRARMTLAHELGHAVMHPGAPKARRMAGNITHRFIPAYKSAEHQAKVFASEFLIPESAISTLDSPEKISIKYGVSLEAAEYRFRDPTEANYRAEGAAKLAKLATELRSEPLHYISERCTSCGNATLIPIGVKYLCHTCDAVTDQFTDGDSHG
jgi:hypothetical protein